MAKKDTTKKDDLGLAAKDAEAVKGGVNRKSHAEVHATVHQNVKKNIHTGPQKT